MTTSTELAIRLRRAAFNKALLDADLNSIGPLLTTGAILVTGTDSAVLAGRKAQLTTWKREFAAQERSVYTRTPGTILISPVEPIAFEDGEWTGTNAISGMVTASGRYSAKWRYLGSNWVIEAEIFITLASSTPGR
jgi:hypothetical protein